MTLKMRSITSKIQYTPEGPLNFQNMYNDDTCFYLLVIMPKFGVNHARICGIIGTAGTAAVGTVGTAGTAGIAGPN